MKRRNSFLILLTAAALILSLAAWHLARISPGAESKARYSKHEYRIPMRDGALLFTQVYVPRDAGANDRAPRYPFLITRTPFSVAPYGEQRYRPLLGPSGSFDRAGYIFVFQDVRGRYQSKGPVRGDASAP